jgi:sulfur carrier protein
MQVLLRNPRREVTIDGPRRVHALLNDFGLNRESHLVIRNGTLVPGDELLAADDVVEIRPVISGGAT